MPRKQSANKTTGKPKVNKVEEESEVKDDKKIKPVQVWRGAGKLLHKPLPSADKFASQKNTYRPNRNESAD